MKWDEFWQIFLLFPLFLGCIVFSIIILNSEGLDTYFLITFIIAIFTIILSIYYYGKTNQVFSEITTKMSGLEKGNVALKLSMNALSRKVDKSKEVPITEEGKKVVDEVIKKIQKSKK